VWRTAIYIAAFLVLWQIAAAIGDRILIHGRLQPLYPVAAVEVLLLVFAGWKTWPFIPLAALIRFIFFQDHVGTQWASPIVQTMVGIGFALGVRYLVNDLRVEIPLRRLRDAALFCGILAIAIPAIVGVIVVTFLVMIASIPVDEVFAQYSRYVFGDAGSIVILVPMTLTFVGWKKLEPPADHRKPSDAEAIVSVVATLAFAVGGNVLATYTREPVLDLSFLPVAWLAIRYGFRGAAVGIALSCVGTFGSQLILRVPGADAVQSEGFLFASAIMALLVAGLSTEVWELLAKLSRRAFVDELTGLPNREKLVDWIERHKDGPLVLIILDVDEMRLLNQGVGRMQADMVLQEIATRVRTGLPWSHFVARVSADEFAVAVVDDRSPHAIIESLRGYFDAPFEVEGSRMYVSVALGAVRSIRTLSADELLRKADAALDHAKSSPSRSAVYSPDLNSAEAPTIVGELHRAAENHELVPFYQPIFKYDEHTKTWRVAGAEALLRWNHPERGILPPSAFLSLLERLTIGDHVGWNVMEQGLLQAVVWRRTIPDFRVWVNMFSRQVLHKTCEAKILEVLERTGVSPDALMVEINESVVASDEQDVASVVRKLRTHGVLCAIDDFGTGGSSLGRVRDVPATILKIDRSFVTMSEVDAKAHAVANTVVRLARELGMQVVAEGVENAAQLDVMMKTGCEYMQGYLLGHPLPADLFEQTFLEAERVSTA
jgi:diguanylate cyclase (GGDEF)-like protein